MNFDYKTLEPQHIYCAKWKDFCDAQYMHAPIHIAPRTPQEQFPLHNHDFDELIYVYKGYGINFFKNKFKLILPGHVFFYQPRHYHAYPLSQNLHLLNILINKNNFSDDFPYFQKLSEELNSYQKKLFPIPLTYHDFLKLRSLAEKIKDENIQDDSYSQLMVSSIFHELMIIVLRSLKQQNKEISAAHKTGFGFFKLLKSDILTQVMSCQALREILAKNHINERKFNNFLTQITGLTPKALMNCNRFIMFSNLYLEGKNHNLTELSYMSGYGDYRSFSRHISSYLGLSPKAYCQILDPLKNLKNAL